MSFVRSLYSILYTYMYIVVVLHYLYQFIVGTIQIVLFIYWTRPVYSHVKVWWAEFRKS